MPLTRRTACFSLRFEPTFKIPGAHRAKPHEAFILQRIDVDDEEDEEERDEFHMPRSVLPKWYYNGALGQQRLAAARQAMQNASAKRAVAASPAADDVTAHDDNSLVFVEEDRERKVGGATASAAWSFVRIKEDGKKVHIVNGVNRGLERLTEVVCIVGQRNGAKCCKGDGAWEASIWQSSTGAIGKHLQRYAARCPAHKAALKEYQNTSKGYVQTRGLDGQEMMVPVMNFEESFYHSVRATLVIICTTNSE